MSRFVSFCLFSLAIFVTAHAQEQKPIDLSGTWTADDAELAIKHTGNNVEARFMSGGDCPNPEKDGQQPKRDFFIKGQLQGEKMTGTMWRCTRDPDLINKCDLDSMYSTNFTITEIKEDEISGTYRTEWYDPAPPDPKDCRYKRNAAGDHDEPFTLTRTTGIYVINSTTFIPFSYVDAPPEQRCGLGLLKPLYYHGDGDQRYFDPNSPAYRTRQVVKLIPEEAVEPSGFKDEPEHKIGESRSYAPDAIADGVVDYRDDDAVLGDCKLLHKRATASTSKMKADVTRINEHKVSVRLHGGAANPLLIEAPSIDWDFTITIDTSGGSPAWTLKGAHDGFPGYEIYINNQRIYGRVPAGKTIAEINKLFPPLDVKIDRSGSLQ
jgi:hypothetical protein